MIITSTETARWKKGETSGEKGFELTFGSVKQSVRGFGGCFNELGMIALNKLPEQEKEAFLDELFNKGGCNFNYCRAPMGSNDFSTEYYSYDDTDGDFAMECFSVKRDEEYVLPFIKEGMKRQPDLQLWSSPWCPPTWLKTVKTHNYGVFNDTEENLKAYALYFKKYVEEYKARGIPLVQVAPQNEPCVTQPFPSCEWTGEKLIRFVGKYLGPALEGTGVDILFGTINGPDPSEEKKIETSYAEYLGRAMQDKDCRKYVKGVGYQWAGKYALLQTQDDYPDLEIVQTESECGDGKNDWKTMLYVFGLMRRYFRLGASAYVYWNMALEDGGLSTWGWRQNSLLTVKNGKAIYNPEFYLMKHFSHFVERGAKYICVKGEFSSNVVGFINPDGEKILIAANPYAQAATIRIEGRAFLLPPYSINTVCL